MTLAQILQDVRPDTGSSTKTHITFQYVSEDELWLITEEVKPDGSYADAVTRKFKLVND